MLCCFIETLIELFLEVIWDYWFKAWYFKRFINSSRRIFLICPFITGGRIRCRS